MDFFEVVKNRHSIRKFKNKEIEDEKLNKILEVMNSAPSAGNLQAYEVILVRDKNTKNKVVNAIYYGQDFVAGAPIVLVVCANEKRSSVKYGERGKLYAVQDATIAASYIQLASTALGLASVWVGAFDEIAVSNVINTPKNIKPIAIVPIGYSNEKPQKTLRKNLSDIIHNEKFYIFLQK